MRVGIDAHKMHCTTTVTFDGDSVTGSFDFQTTRQGVYEFMEKVPEGSIAVIESSTAGKVLSRMLSGKESMKFIWLHHQKGEYQSKLIEGCREISDGGYAQLSEKMLHTFTVYREYSICSNSTDTNWKEDC